MAEPRKRHGAEEAKQLILDAAEKRFRVGGMAAVRVQLVAQDVGMTDAAVHNGLSPYGKKIVQEMNRLGMLVDVSHVSDKTVADALETSRAPVIASHSSAKAVADVPRNMTDNVIRSIAAKGGVICINFSVAYLDKKAYDTIWPVRANRQQEVRDVMAQHVPRLLLGRADEIIE